MKSEINDLNDGYDSVYDTVQTMIDAADSIGHGRLVTLLGDIQEKLESINEILNTLDEDEEKVTDEAE